MVRIKEFRLRKGLKQKELGKMIGVSESTISLYESGRREPDTKTWVMLADKLGATVDELIGREWTENTLSFGLSALPEMQSIPLLGDIACGTPITAEENLDGYVNVPVDVVCHFALRCKGDSMAPRVQDGDLVYIRQQPDVEDGQIAAVLIDNEATLKRVYHTAGGVHLVAENPAYAPMIYTGDACNDIRILGLAVAYQRMLV